MNQKSLPHDYTSEISAGELALSAAEDRFLVQQIAYRRQDAFAELYRRFSGMLFNFLNSLVGEATAAEDLLQEVFLAVWKGAGRYRGAASVKTWIFNIAYKQGISWLRRRKDMPMEDYDHLPASDDPEQSVLDRWQSQEILLAFNQLSPQHRAVLELVLYYEMPYAEVAAVLGCPIGTVKSRVSYARKQLETLILVRGISDEENG